MCGIIGIIGKNNVSSTLIAGLKRLEYRGYDSAGIATNHNGHIHARRAEGKIPNLELEIKNEPLDGNTGIAHVRWATHGRPIKRNAHPITTDQVAVVHNGIIENFQALRSELTANGHEFVTETDTEVVPQLISHYLAEGLDNVTAARKTIRRLEGAFAIAIMFAGNDNLLIGARKGAPLAVAYGEGEMYLGSDAYALAPLSNKIAYLEDGDFAVLTRENVDIYDKKEAKIERDVKVSNVSGAITGKGNFPHFMLKEIYEQPQVIGDTLNSYFDPVAKRITLPDLNFDLGTISKITIVACGTSYYAGMVAKCWLEEIAGVAVEIDVASEFRYRNPILPEKGLCIFISQSGETADSLAALKLCQELGQSTLAIVNVRDSTIARDAGNVIYTLAGPEIGVASTKAFSTQLAVLALFTVQTALAKGAISEEKSNKLVYNLLEAPGRVAEILNRNDEIEKVANELKNYSDILYTGRQTSYAVALEGALKLKELSYIHAEALAAGELKHGTIALIDENMPVIVICPTDNITEKTISNAEEIAARGGKIVLFGDEAGLSRMKHIYWKAFQMPVMDGFVTPLVYAVPAQLLAYHVALKLGKDIDQPRNLAKSVTVE